MKKRLEAVEKAVAATVITEATPAVLLVMPNNHKGDPRPVRRGRVELHIYDPETHVCGCGGSHPDPNHRPHE